MNTATIARAVALMVRDCRLVLPSRRALAITLAAFVSSVGVAQGATLTVTSLADSGAGTLREAIHAANASAGVADTIGFRVSGTITLASRLPAIDDDLTIDGTGAQITVSGNNAVQVLSVGAGKALNLNTLTIANGYCASPCSGGAGLNAGTLNVSDSTFTGNAALLGGAIHNFGSLQVTGSRFFANSARFGGAIHNFDKLIVHSSVFTGNSAARAGGAIHNFDTLDVVGSVFSGNSATEAGSDIFNDVGTSRLMIANSTVSGSGVAWH